MKLLLRAGSVALLASASMACASMHASTSPQGPALDVPAPPPVVELSIEREPESPTAQPSPSPAEARPAGRVSRVTPPRPPAARKTDQPDKTEPPATPVKSGADSAPAAPSLQTTAKVGELEQKIRALLASAARDLEKIDVRTLGGDARTQYDESKRFAQQAEAALKVKNLAFAEQLADKSATLARLLARR